jgi:hypothetical protein
MAQELEKSYFEQVRNSQLNYYRMRFNTLMLEVDNKGLAEECASCLSEIGTRVQIIEELLMAESRVNSNDVVSSAASEWQDTVKLMAKDMQHITNLHELELHGGHQFCWSGADSSISFVMPVKRNRVAELTLDIVAVMKPEFVQEMTINVDGSQIKHKSRNVDGVIKVFARLPKQSNTTLTTIQIVLPTTVSPLELGSSNDMRKMGIALASIGINPVASRFARFIG